MNKKEIIEIILSEYEEHLKTQTIKQLESLLGEIDNNKISY